MKNVRRNNADRPERNDATEADGGQGDTHLNIEQLANDICNIVFMDIDIPGLAPAEVANIFKTAYPDVNVVMFTLHEEKSTPPSSITDFITSVYEATLETNKLAIQKVLTFFNRKNAPLPDPYGLSTRELQVLDCLVDGDTYKKIAEHCHISVGTVRSHIMNIYRKLDVNSRSGAIVKAIQERLIGN